MTGKLLDWDDFLARAEGDLEFARELAGLFTTRAAALIADLKESAATHDANKLRFAAHGLRGALAVFGAAQAVAMAQTLEDIGAAGEAISVGGAVNRLAAMVEQLTSELEARLAE